MTSQPVARAVVPAPLADRAPAPRDDDSGDRRRGARLFEDLFRSVAQADEAQQAKAFLSSSVFGLNGPLPPTHLSAADPQLKGHVPLMEAPVQEPEASSSPRVGPTARLTHEGLTQTAATASFALLASRVSAPHANDHQPAIAVRRQRQGDANVNRPNAAEAPGRALQESDSVRITSRDLNPAGALARRLVAPSTSNRILVAVYAIESGIRIFARVGSMDAADREKLRSSIRTLMGEHGLTAADIDFDTTANAAGMGKGQ